MKKTFSGIVVALLLLGTLTLMFNIQQVKAEPTAIEAVEDLIETIEAWSLRRGTEKSLTSKLNDVIHLLGKGNDVGAIHKLMDFMKQVEALSEKKLMNDQADYLIAEAQKIIDLIQG